MLAHPQATHRCLGQNPSHRKTGTQPEALCDAPKTYNVTVAKVKGEQALKLIDPRFSIMRGISVSQGF